MATDWNVGHQFSKRFEVTDSVVRAFADLSGDRNPIHLDEDFARRSAFGRRIAHGMISGALISATVAEAAPGIVYLGQTMKFTSPVYVGETVEVQMEVIERRADKPIAKLRSLVFSGPERRPVVEGETTVKLPS